MPEPSGSGRPDPGAPDGQPERDDSPAAGELDELLRYEREHAGRPAVLRMLRAHRRRLCGKEGTEDQGP
ncbi:hypothetical protein ABZ883_27280 [Streptomyces sp. NPDC046977]|uniref:hypothetical protein n=1 Tax=Streptomyces sp. NPDC046977 TaxID=3154703 RepID=UPI0033DC32DA